MVKRVFSGIQPTGTMHIGNYFGAIRNWVSLQDEAECIYCIVDYHAITIDVDPKELRRASEAKAIELLACGIDPDRSILFVQSDVPAHTELEWILGCVTSYGDLSRMTQFKDKSARAGSGTNVGLFTYPILQAADILLYDAALVPVGEDQRQHIEITRDLAQRLNSRFGEVFVVPEAHIVRESAKIFDLQDPTAKMSKSAASPNGVVELLDDPKVVAKRIRSAVTDTGREVRYDEAEKPGISNLLTIYSALSGRGIPELEEAYAGKGYGDFKADLAEVVVTALTPFRDRVLAYLDTPGALDDVLADGAERAGEVARATLARTRDRIGLLPGMRR